MTSISHKILKIFGSIMPFSIVLVAYYTLFLSHPNGVIVRSGSEFFVEAFVIFPAILILMAYSFCYDYYNLFREDR